MPSYRLPDRERSLFELYEDANRGSDVPPCFHPWALACIIGAVVSPFVYAYTIPDQPVTPDMRVFLICKSGGGKGKAMGRARSILADLAWPRGRVFCVDGSMTKPLFIKTVSEWQRGLRDEGIVEWDQASVLLVHQELLDDLGVPEAARNFISYATNISSRHTDTHAHGSIYAGGVHMTRGLALSWIAGTTIDWLKRVYDPDAIRSGAFSRIIPVYVPDEDIPPQRGFESHPANFESTLYDIRSRLVDLSHLRGAFKWTDGARNVYAAGVERETGERDPAMDAAWSREREYVLKYAMIHALAQPRLDSLSPLTLTEGNIAEAQRQVRRAFERAAPLYHVASETRETQGLHAIEAYIKRKRNIREKVFLSWVKASGLDPDRVKRQVRFLIESGLVMKDQAPQPIGWTLLWIGDRGGKGGKAK